MSEAMDSNGEAGDTTGANGETCENLLRPNKKISLNDFELVKVIGRGSFGKVYLVKRNGTESYYAMKKLRKEVVAKRNLFIKTQGKWSPSRRITVTVLYS
jgi:serine/threonine protein kinase